MKTLIPFVIAALSFITTPTLAAGLVCPAPVILPQTLNAGAQGANLKPLEAYLANLRIINDAYIQAWSKAQRNEITNCLMDHLVTLADNHSLQQPQTRADGSTWFLLREEVIAAIETHAATLNFKPQLPAIYSWLNTTPQYGNSSPYNLATR